MREHGTVACYVHGPHRGARNTGCRCAQCREAARAGERVYRNRVAPPYVSADPARTHIESLRGEGVGLKQIAAVAGVSHGALSKLVYGDSTNGRGPTRRIRPGNLERILAVTPSDRADGGRVPAGPVWDQIEALCAAGMPKAEIARRLGHGRNGLQLSRHQVTARTARVVADMHRQLCAGSLTWIARSKWGDRRVTASTPAQPPARPQSGDCIDGLFNATAGMLEQRIDQREWRTRAACGDQDPWLFFPDRFDTETRLAALAICEQCPVTGACLAAHIDEQNGIWGGTTAQQRAVLRTRRDLEVAS